MTEFSTLGSFIVRIYRVDTEDDRKVAGLVEVMDGSGSRESFTDLDKLGEILSRRAGRTGKGRGKSSKPGGL